MKRVHTSLMARLLIAWFGLASYASHASTATPIFTIDAEAGSAVELQLGPDIYRYSQRSNLSDLVLLDSQGNRLPFRIQPKAGSTTTRQESTRVGFYPVATGTNTEQLKLESGTAIILDERAIRIEIDKQQNTTTAPAIAAPAFYLADIRELQHPVTHLRIEWPEEDTEHYRRIAIAGSQDLQRWTPLADHTLVQLRDQQQQLSQNRIPLIFNADDYQYLKLTLLDKREALVIAGLYLEADIQKSEQAPWDQWTLTGKPARSQVSVAPKAQSVRAQSVAAWEFEREDSLAISRVAIALGEKSYSDNLALYSRAKPSQDWQLVHRGLWFNTPVANGWQQSQPLMLNTNAHKYWRLEMAESFREQLQPELVFSHPAQVLQFMANPFAPYQLAIDSSNANNYHQVQAQIFQQILGDQKPVWQLQSARPLHGEDFRPPVEARNMDWKLIIFWLALVAAVLVLIVFAWRLIRQMQ